MEDLVFDLLIFEGLVLREPWKHWEWWWAESFDQIPWLGLTAGQACRQVSSMVTGRTFELFGCPQLVLGGQSLS